MSTEVSRYRLDVDVSAFRQHAKDMDRYTKRSSEGVDDIEKSLGRLPGSVSKTAGRLSEAFRYTKASASAASAFAKEMHGVETATGDAADEAGRLEQATQGAKRWLGGLLAAGGATAAARYLYGLGDAAQTARTSFTTLLGSTEAADRMLKEMASFAASTPFELSGLKDNVRFMLAMGFEAEQALPLLAQIGDAVSSLGGGEAEIQRVVRALGQMQQKGKVSAEELNQLAEVGIGGWKYLAAEFETTIGDVQKAAEAGALDVNRAVQAIARGMGTEFAGGMAALSDTAAGALSSVRDVATQTLTALTAGAFDELTADLRAVRDSMDGVNAAAGDGTVREWSDRIAYAYRVAREFVQILASWLPVIGKVGAAVVTFKVLASVVGAVSQVVVGLRVASLAGAAAQKAFNSSLTAGAARMVAFNAVVKANPLGLLVTVLGAVVTAMAAFRAASARSATAVREENEALADKIRLLREMPGAELFAERGRARNAARDAQQEYARLQEEKRRIQARTYDDRVAYGGGFGNNIETGAQQRARDLAAVNAQIVESGRALRGAMTEFAAVGREANRDLDTRLGYLQSEFDEITASTRMTAEQRDRAAELRAEIAGINVELSQRRDTGGLGSGSSGSGSDGPSEATLRRLANEAAAIEKRATAERAAAAAFAEDMARREELATALGSAERQAVEDVHAAEQELARARADYAKHRGSLAAEEREQAERTITLLERRAEAERDVLDAVRAASRAAMTALEARPLVVDQEAVDKAKELEGRFEKIVVPASRIGEVVTSDLEAAVGLADDLSRAFADMGQTVLADLARSVGDVVSAVDRVNKARAFAQSGAGQGALGALATLGASAGVFGAVVGAVGGLVSAFKARAERERKLEQAVEDTTDALHDNTRALLSGGQVGADLSADDVREISRVIWDLGGLDLSETFFDGLKADGEVPEALIDLFDRLSDAGLGDMAADARAAIGAALEAGDARGFVDIVRGLMYSLAELTAAAGTYSADLGGAIDRLQDQQRYGGAEGADALAAFLDDLRDADRAGALGEGGAAFLDVIESRLAGLDVGSDAYETALQGMFRDVQSGALSLGGAMSEADLRALLDALQGIRPTEGTETADPDRRFGQYADDVAGAMEAFADAVRFGGQTGADAVAYLADRLRGQADDLGDFSGLLDSIEGLDLATPEGQAALDALIADAFGAMEAGGFDMGDLAADEVDRLLSLLQSLGGGFEAFDEAVRNALGSYSDDVDGALAEFSDRLRFLGLEGADALTTFYRLMGEQGQDLGAFAAALEEAAALDLDTDDGRAALSEIVAGLFEGLDAGTLDVGDLTAEQAEALLAAMARLGDGFDGVGAAIARRFGEFGDTFAGAAEHAREFARYLGEDATAALRRFLSAALDGESGASLSDAARALLEEALTLDLDETPDADRLHQIVADLASGALSGMDGGEAAALLDMLLGLADGAGQAAEALARFGDYSADASGALDRWNDAVKYLGLEGQAAAEALFAMFARREREAGDFAGLMERAGRLNVESAEGAAELERMIAAAFQGILAGTFDVGEMTAAEVRQLMDSLLGLAGAADDAAEALRRFGDYDDDIAGALAAFDDQLKYLGLEGQEAVRAFLRLMRSQGQDLGDFAGALDALEMLALGTPEGTAALEALIAQIYRGLAEGTFDVGGLDEDGVRRMLDTLRGIGDAAGYDDQTGGSATSVSTSTVEQADLQISYLQETLRLLRRWYTWATGQEPPGPPIVNVEGPIVNVPPANPTPITINLPVFPTSPSSPFDPDKGVIVRKREDNEAPRTRPIPIPRPGPPIRVDLPRGLGTGGLRESLPQPTGLQGFAPDEVLREQRADFEGRLARDLDAIHAVLARTSAPPTLPREVQALLSADRSPVTLALGNITVGEIGDLRGRLHQAIDEQMPEIERKLAAKLDAPRVVNGYTR